MEEAPPHKLLKHCLHCLYYSMQYSVLELILPVWIIQNFQAPLPKSASSCVWTSCDGCPINPSLMQLRHIFAHLLAGGVLARDFQWTSPNLVVCGWITCLHAQLIPIKHCLLDLDPPKLSQTDNFRANLGIHDRACCIFARIYDSHLQITQDSFWICVFNLNFVTAW